MAWWVSLSFWTRELWGREWWTCKMCKMRLQITHAHHWLTGLTVELSHVNFSYKTFPIKKNSQSFHALYLSSVLQWVTFPAAKRELYHVTRFSIHLPFAVHFFFTKISSLTTLLFIRIVLDCSYLLFFYIEKFSTWIWPLPFFFFFFFCPKSLS